MTAKEVKQLSEQTIATLGLKAKGSLPMIEDFSSLQFQNPKEIARRIIVLSYIVPISFNVKRSLLRSTLKTYKLDPFLSQKERKLLNKWFLSRQDRIDASWVTESIEVLGWSIGLWDSINPLERCDEDKQAKTLPVKRDPTEFIEGAKLIDKIELYKQADLIYRLHAIAKRKTFGKLKGNTADVYSERHKAINWIINTNMPWDDVVVDT